MTSDITGMERNMADSKITIQTCEIPLEYTTLFQYEDSAHIFYVEWIENINLFWYASSQLPFY